MIKIEHISNLKNISQLMVWDGLPFISKLLHGITHPTANRSWLVHNPLLDPLKFILGLILGIIYQDLLIAMT